MGSSWTKGGTHVPCTGRQILYHSATRETPHLHSKWHILVSDDGKEWTLFCVSDPRLYFISFNPHIDLVKHVLLFPWEGLSNLLRSQTVHGKPKVRTQVGFTANPELFSLHISNNKGQIIMKSLHIFASLSLFVKFLFIYLLVAPQSMWDLSFSTRDWTCVLCIRR